jgi:putative holliday junction resolvase
VSGERARSADLFRLPPHRLPLAAHNYLGSMPIPPTGRLLGVDWGELRIGLALSDETQTLATPLETLRRRAGKRFPMPRFLEITALHQAVGVVVGLPLAPSGGDAESTVASRELAEALERRSGLPVALWDERMSTARALASIREQGGSTRGRKADVDALAAAVLLQHFLDARRNRAKAAKRAEESTKETPDR